MCELTGTKMAAALHAELRRADAVPNPLAMLDAFFAPHLARADALSRKIAKAAQTCRSVDDDDDLMSTQP